MSVVTVKRAERLSEEIQSKEGREELKMALKGRQGATLEGMDVCCR